MTARALGPPGNGAGALDEGAGGVEAAGGGYDVATIPQATRMTRQEALDLARSWAKRRIPAGPIAISWDEGKQATNKRPLTRNGHQSFVTDLNRLDELFGSPMTILVSGEVYGVGLHPGPADRVVLDVDTKGGKQGDVQLAALESEHGPLPPHPIVDTASGGTHVWLTKPEGVHVGNPDLAEGIEVRADDGWVVAPGTFTPWGSWTTREGTNIPAPMWPDWIAQRLNGHKNGSAGRSTGRWQKLDRTKLDPRDLAALEALKKLGGHGEVLGPDEEIRITRPDKKAGVSASIGYLDPGVVKVFTDNWKPLRKGAVYSVDELEATGRGDGKTAEKRRPSTTTDTRSELPDEPYDSDLANARRLVTRSATNSATSSPGGSGWSGTAPGGNSTTPAKPSATPRSIADALPGTATGRPSRTQPRPASPACSPSPPPSPASPYHPPNSTPIPTCSTSPTAPSTCTPASYGRTTRTTCSPRSAAPPTTRTPTRPSSTTFLAQIQPDQTMRDFLARLFGHALLGRSSNTSCAMLYGIRRQRQNHPRRGGPQSVRRLRRANRPRPAHRTIRRRPPNRHRRLFGLRLAVTTKPTPAAGWPKAQ